MMKGTTKTGKLLFGGEELTDGEHLKNGVDYGVYKDSPRFHNLLSISTNIHIGSGSRKVRSYL